MADESPGCVLLSQVSHLGVAWIMLQVYYTYAILRVVYNKNDLLFPDHFGRPMKSPKSCPVPMSSTGILNSRVIFIEILPVYIYYTVV